MTRMLFDCEHCTAANCAGCVDGDGWRNGTHPGISDAAWADMNELLGGEPDGYTICKEAK